MMRGRHKVANWWSKEKAGHSLWFANGTSKLRKICRAAKQFTTTLDNCLGNMKKRLLEEDFVICRAV